MEKININIWMIWIFAIGIGNFGAALFAGGSVAINLFFMLVCSIVVTYNKQQIAKKLEMSVE